MRIKIAKKAGFCMGVRRAVNLVLKSLNSNQTPIYTYGPLIHNPQTLEFLYQLGIRIIKNLDEEVSPGFCVIRAHGIPPQEKSALEARHTVIDGTCPRVLKVQALAKKAAAEGKKVIIIGDKDHAEVKGILGYCEGKGYVVSSFQDIDKLPSLKDYVILSQTTQDEEVFQILSREILSKFPEGEIINTICNATEVRQDEVKRLSKDCSAIIVIGGKFSANTNRLAQIAQEEGKEVFLIEKPEELPLEILRKHSTVGITAGASTPNWLINEVVDYLKYSFSSFYRFFRLFILLNLHKVFLFLFLIFGLIIAQPKIILPSLNFFFLFIFFFLFFLYNLNDYLLKDSFIFYYPIKEKFIFKNKRKILTLLVFSFIFSIISAFMYQPRMLSLIIILTLLFFLLNKTPFSAFLEIIFFISIISYLYPLWNEVFLWLSFYILFSLLFLRLYAELLYLQSDGFLTQSFFITYIKKEESFWFKVLYFLLTIAFLPFLVLTIKYQIYLFLLYFLSLPSYLVLIYFLKRRPLGQILYLESLSFFTALSFLIISFFIFIGLGA